jgi:hypothetical protein
MCEKRIFLTELSLIKEKEKRKKEKDIEDNFN